MYVRKKKWKDYTDVLVSLLVIEHAMCRFLVTVFLLRPFQGYKPTHTMTNRNHECLMGHGFLSDHHRIIQLSKLRYFGIFMTI